METITFKGGGLVLLFLNAKKLNNAISNTC